MIPQTPSGRRRGPAVGRAALVPLVTAALACGLAGCSSGGDTPDQPDTPQPIASVLASMDATASPTYGRLPTVAAAPKDATYLPWSAIRIEPDTGKIYLAADQKGCAVPASAVVKETAESVTISIVADAPTASSTPCTAQKSTLVGYVKTSQPLGDRKVLHGRS
jgi:hypothetical protein